MQLIIQINLYCLIPDSSILQMHPDVTIVADEAALSKCDL